MSHGMRRWLRREPVAVESQTEAMKGTLLRHHDDVLEEAMSSPPADIGVLGGGKTSACGGIRSQWSLSRDSTVP